MTKVRKMERGDRKVGKVGKGCLEGGKGGEVVVGRWESGGWKVGKGWLEGIKGWLEGENGEKGEQV